MDAGEDWLTLANENLHAAGKLRELECWRSCVSRSYYAAFAGAHAALLALGRSQPRETMGTWSHASLGGTLKTDTQAAGLREREANSLKNSLAIAKNLRESADYVPKHTVDKSSAMTAIMKASEVVQYARKVAAL